MNFGHYFYTLPNTYNAGSKINSASPDVCVGVAKSGDKIYIYNANNNGDISELKLVDNQWKTSSELPFINTTAQETSVSLTADEKFIYFISDREGTIGEKDIFMTIRKDDNSYSKPVNLGKKINTIYNEESVFVNATNDTLFFSSEGHNSIGGYDIFRSIKNSDNQWTDPTNLAYPFSSPSDDMYYSKHKNYHFFTSTRTDVIGEADVFVAFTPKPIEEVVIIEKNDPDTLVTKIEPEIKIEPKTDVKIEQKNKDLTAEKDYISKQKIVFLLEKYEVSTSYKNTLDTIANILKANSELVVIISGHTDNTGSVEYNTKLSEKRANAVAEYLKSKGVNQQQITTKAEADKLPIHNNSTLQGRAKNRRVDFKIKD